MASTWQILAQLDQLNEMKSEFEERQDDFSVAVNSDPMNDALLGRTTGALAQSDT
jgi:hypothetical protein